MQSHMYVSMGIGHWVIFLSAKPWLTWRRHIYRTLICAVGMSNTFCAQAHVMLSQPILGKNRYKIARPIFFLGLQSYSSRLAVVWWQSNTNTTQLHKLLMGQIRYFPCSVHILVPKSDLQPHMLLWDQNTISLTITEVKQRWAWLVLECATVQVLCCLSVVANP